MTRLATGTLLILGGSALIASWRFWVTPEYSQPFVDPESRRAYYTEFNHAELVLRRLVYATGAASIVSGLILITIRTGLTARGFAVRSHK